MFIEEPETESEGSASESEYDGFAPSEDDERVYDFDLDSNDDDASEIYYDSDGYPEGEYEEIFVIPEDFDGVDVNDDLENEALDALEAEGVVRDVNDDLVRFYDSDSESDISSSDEYDSDIEDIPLADYLESDSESDSSESESESESDSDSEAESTTDLELDSEEELEDLRLALAQVAESSDEESVSEEEADDVFFEIDSDHYTSEDEDDIVVDEDMSSDSSDSSDDEGITIYKHRFDLPDRYDSENDSTDAELEYSDDDLLLKANDSDDEFDVIDLSKDLKGSKDCELVELDDETYKLNLRLPSLIKEDLKINFLKNENELVITGKFNFTFDESDSEEEADEDTESQDKMVDAQTDIVAEAKEDKVTENDAESSSSSSDSDSSSSDSDSDSDSDSSSSSSSSSSSDSSSESESESESDDEEEVMEDAQELIKDLQNHEIQFEKRFVFDKVVKFDEIKAAFLDNGELELIIPNEGVEVDSKKNNVAIQIEGQPEQQNAIAAIAEVEAVAEAVAEAATADIEMAT